MFRCTSGQSLSVSSRVLTIYWNCVTTSTKGTSYRSYNLSPIYPTLLDSSMSHRNSRISVAWSHLSIHYMRLLTCMCDYFKSVFDVWPSVRDLRMIHWLTFRILQECFTYLIHFIYLVLDVWTASRYLQKFFIFVVSCLCPGRFIYWLIIISFINLIHLATSGEIPITLYASLHFEWVTLYASISSDRKFYLFMLVC